ncbi:MULTISPECIES: molybdate ABC transporter permease subunit [unclassified Actinomyces]|uniref:molybdate ABC transporter permease subunit n=1 Tax=unclassified Actinomyces TaxID=2609248 RepID=UPI002893639F|nr:molybdate ABC transporter permease subunit [Actinomyces sp. 187325]MCL3778508.1 molybdate ABC transporter permease subunit [Actinomyces sp. AC-20-1]MCL3790142.1 molybdate ABC transporter permease subunit [Actinomyces sp. 187325]MCL3792348.1 molybdate ABC transporter permease subunit [Actinomyces sp. 186855]MCL3794935.1 molybdate ABC transporter permease subunit [Actinomyces sp. 217892]
MSARRHRAARSPLPAPVLLLGVLGAAALLLPFVGLGTRVAWADVPALLASGPARAALGLSLRTCVVATAVSVLLGVPLALLLARQWPGVRAARVLAVLPMTMPPVVAGIALLSTLGKRGLLGPGLESAGVQVSFTTTAVVVAQVFVSMPYLVVTLEAALRSRDRRAETVARTLGAGPWTVLGRLTLPLVAPALARGTALALGRSLGEFGATIAFAGSKEGVTRTMPLAIYLERENDTATSLALAVVLIALSLVVVGATNVPWSRLTGLAGPWRQEEGVLPPGADRGATGAHGTAAAAGRAVHLSFTCAERGVAVDLDVGAGRSVALVGPNGSGKSTACAVLAGLLDADGGSVSVGGRLLDGGAPGSVFVPAGRRGVALLSQAPGVFTHMSVLDNVAFGPRCQGLGRAAARERALAELVAVGAAHLAHRPGSQLSGGQAARVALARALATDPAVLVLDEPMAALDVTARQEMRLLVARRAAEQGLTLLLVTHDVLDLTALADEVVVLESGRVVESGPTARVLATPSSSFTARLTGTSVLTGRLEGEAGAPVLVLADGTRVAGRPGGPWEGPGRQGLALVPPDAVALVPPDAVALYPAGGGAHGSPRNTLPVTVTALERAGSLVQVRLALGDGQGLSAVVTAGAVADLGLEPGGAATCAVKAVQVRLLTSRGALTGQAAVPRGALS